MKKTTPRTLLAFCSLATVAALEMLGVDLNADDWFVRLPIVLILPIKSQC